MPETDINKLDISNRMLKAYEQKQNVDHDIIMRDEELGFSYRNSGAQDMLEEAERFETSAMEQSEIDTDGTRVIEGGLLNGLAKGATRINEILGIDGAVNYLSESFADSTGIRLRTKEPETIGGQLASGVGQALPGIVPAVSALRTAGYGPLLAELLGGFIGDFATSDVSDAEGLAQLIQMIPSETAQQFGDVVQDFVRDPESGDEKDLQARLVGSIPGLILTPLLSGIGRLVVAAKNSGAGQEILEFINAAGESAQQRIAQKTAERGATLNMGVDPTDLTDPLIAGAGKLAGVGINQPKRVGTTGQYIGAPKGLDTPAKLGAMRRNMLKIAKQGEQGRFWYERSSNAILDAVNGNKEAADKIAQAIAITSGGQTPVASNFEFAIQAYNQWLQGKPIVTSRFPNQYGPKLQKVFDGGSWEGRKTNTFYNNVMVNIDPTRSQGVTVDMHMMRVFGFKSENPSNAQYEFVENEVNRIANKLGWTPYQTQAAMWIVQKAKKDNKSIKDMSFDYKDALERSLGQISWETKPSATSGHFAELFTAPQEQQAEFHFAIAKALTGDDGTDLLAKEIGLLSPGSFDAPGVFEGQVSPGTQTLALMPKKYKGKVGEVDEATLELVKMYSVARGILLKQDGVGFHRPFWNKNIPQNQLNGLDVNIGRSLTNEEAIQLDKLITEKTGMDFLSPVSTDSGFRLLNFTDGSEGQIPNKDYRRMMEEVLDVFEISGINRDDNEANVKLFKAQLGYVGNNWKEAPNGEIYIKDSFPGRPDLQKRVQSIVSKYADRIKAVDDEFESKYGWVQNRSLNSAYRRIDEIDQDQALPLEVPDG